MNFLLSLSFILLPFISIVLSQGAVQSPSLVPSSTFLDPTSTSSITNSIASPNSAIGTGTSAVNSTSLSISTTATITAQFPTLSNVSSCVSTCLAEGSARLNCMSVVDVNCFCVNALYPFEIVDCVLNNCPNQVATIESLAQQFCSIASVHPTLTFPALPTTPTSTSMPTSTSNSTATQTPTSTTPTNSTGFSTSGSTSLLGLGVLLVLSVVLGV